jgi:hypothetical protein
MGDGTLKAIDQLYPGAVVASKQEPSATEATDRGSAATIRERDKKFEARSNSPYPDDYDEIDPRNWRAIKLTLDHGNGQTTAIELLRPVPWVAFLDARIGGAVELQIPEMGVAGWAKVIAIEPCPTVEAPYDLGSRQIIGQFVTTNATIIDLFIQGVEEAIGTTPSHPFWSIDRGGWVEAGDLRKGEKLQTLKGTATVETVKARPGTRTVYNIEIHKDHTFFVSSAHLWVHNQCMRDAKEALRKNDDFRKWFHKNYAPEMKGGSLDENPDLPDEDILDAFLEWLELGRPKAD